MEELKKVDLTGSFSVLTRDGRCGSCSSLARNDEGRRGGDER